MRWLRRLLLELLREEPAQDHHDSPSAEPWNEDFLYDYAKTRYEEIDRLILQTRQSSQSLLTWQSAVFFGFLGVSAKTGLLRFSNSDCLLTILMAGSLVALAGALIISARTAFWTETTDVPTSPRNLFTDLCQAAIDKRGLCENLVEAYETSKGFVAILQRKIKVSIWLTALAVLLIVALFIVLSTSHEAVLDRLFSVK